MALSDQHLTNIQNELQPIQDELDNAASALSTAQGTITGQQTQIAQLQQENATLKQQLAAVQSPAPTPTPTPAPAPAPTLDDLFTIVGIKALTNIQKQKWSQMPGTTANTGTVGGTGTGLYTPGDIATMLCKPDAQPQTNGWYDAGYSYDTGLTLDAPRVIRYGGQWLLSAKDLPNCHQLELDASYHSGSNRYHPSAALNFSSKTITYYDPQGKVNADGTKAGAWLDTKIPFTLTAGQWLEVIVLGKVDLVNKNFVYMGIKVGGVVHQFDKTVTANPNTWKAQFKPIQQLDSNKNGVAFTAQSQNINLVIVQ